MTAERAIDQGRDLDPNVRQRRASDPLHSVWVGASAGTGKTKVLTDRVLRLLLPRTDGRPGTPAHRILCLTFTKAGASEMLQRINKILGQWAVIDDETLTKNLRDLTGTPPAPQDIEAARKLFATVVDTPGGLKIMTIHSFCQSVLGRFPLEAGLPPHFSIIDDGAANDLLASARDQVLEQARITPDSALGQAVRAVAAAQNEEQFGRLLKSLCSERQQLADAVGMDMEAALRGLFNLAPGDTEQTILAAACDDSAFDRDALYRACRALTDGKASDQERSIAIQLWLDDTPESRAVSFETYKAQYLTAKDEPRARLATKGVLDAAPEAGDSLLIEAQRLIVVLDSLKAARCVTLTRNLLLLGEKIIGVYQSLKNRRGVLDYDDLIQHTLSLLADTDRAPWVLYKLDGGLDHILIDEAQDTNPEQWKIISCLCEDFFSGAGARDDVERTIFTVGDEKQSIYSFQRAAPAEFERMRLHFAAIAKTREEKLAISFRSVKSVLALVDETFSPPHLRAGLSREPIEHHSFRRGQAGLVEIWPLCAPAETPPEEPWTPPVEIIETLSGQAILAEKIGDTIKSWLENGEFIPSLNRPVQPGDIMILMRTRTAFVGQLVRALKTRNIPVSGVDRMVLGEQIAVMDLLALAQFALLPGDDLNLACILKSPLIGLNEDQLYNLCVDRRFTLWEALKDSDYREIVNWLGELIRAAAADHPYEFFARILQSPCPADRISGQRAMLKRLGNDALDPLDEFLNASLSYERDHMPTLQGFLLWQQQGDLTIKRELEEAGQAVRIMTVHGAKGLQAPVVMMPDTTRTASSKKMDTLLWPDKTGLKVPLWAVRSDDFPVRYREARGRYEDYLEEEYRRLLYVAMTRAEDRLYVCGYQGKRAPIEDSWYNYIAAAFDRMEGVEDIGGVKRLTNPQTAKADRAETGAERTIRGEDLPVPAWLFQPAPEEPEPPQTLMPSRPSEPEPAVRSPLDGGQDYRFRRGIITHRLLQLLPELPADRRHTAAAQFAALPGHGLPAALQREIVSETMAILEHPDYAPLFGPDALAEVPVTGLVAGRLISAQLDRLLIADDKISIVDFKTNRPPPLAESDVPAVYRDQLRAYRDICRVIYPDKTVECFLLWTDGPRLMRLDDL